MVAGLKQLVKSTLNNSTESDMQLIIGIILGIVVSTIGFSGVARVLDKSVDTIKQTSQQIK